MCNKTVKCQIWEYGVNELPWLHDTISLCENWAGLFLRFASMVSKKSGKVESQQTRQLTHLLTVTDVPSSFAAVYDSRFVHGSHARAQHVGCPSAVRSIRATFIYLERTYCVTPGLRCPHLLDARLCCCVSIKRSTSLR
jgi:hypothetical protein